MAQEEINQIRNTLQSVRNRRECQWICEPPPSIGSFSQANGGGGGKSATGGSLLNPTGDLNLTTVTADLGVIDRIENEFLISQVINTFQLDVTQISGFTTVNGGDVILSGPADDPECNIFWDSSECTLFVNADMIVTGDVNIRKTEILVVEDPIITLGGITQATAPANNDFGFEFQWFDPDVGVSDLALGISNSKRGFFGFDSSIQKFVAINSGINTAETFGPPSKIADLLVDELCVRQIAAAPPPGAPAGLPLSITAVNIDMHAYDNITVTSATLLQQVQEGMVLSSSGTLGIDILSLDGDIDILNNNAAINICTINDVVEICTTGIAGDDIIIKSNGASVNLVSTENVPDAITLDTTIGGGGIKITSNDAILIDAASTSGIQIISNSLKEPFANDLDICAFESSINIKTNNNVADAITINATDGGIDITSIGEDIDICALDDGSVNICSYADEPDAITINAINGGLIVNSDDSISINSVNGGINVHADDNIEINAVNGSIDIISNGSDGIDISAYDGDIDMCAFDGAINICSGANQPDAITINATNGGIDIISNGEHGDNVDITTIDGSIHLTSTENVVNAIELVSTDGGIILESTGEDIRLCAIDGIVSIKGDSVEIINNEGDNLINIDTTEGIVSAITKVDYRVWISYMRFDPSTNGVWITQRDLVSGSNPLYYWRKRPNAEVSYLSVDISESIRSTADKGFKLKKILLSYSIETSGITSLVPVIIKKTFNELLPTSSISFTNIPFTDDNLAAGIGVGTHYRSISVTTPFFVNDESIITFEVCITSTATSVFKFYGMFLQFEQNNF